MESVKDWVDGLYLQYSPKMVSTAMRAGFTAEEAEDLTQEVYVFFCAINALLIVILLGTLLVGAFARNHKKAWLMEGLFLLVLAFVWGTVCFAFRLFPSNTRVKAAFFLLMFLGGAAYNLYRVTKGG